MKKILLIVTVSSFLFLAAGYAAATGVNGVKSDKTSLIALPDVGQVLSGGNHNSLESGDVGIRRGNSEIPDTFNLYIATSPYTLDFTIPPYNFFNIDTDTLSISSPPQNGNVTINDDKIIYETNPNHTETDNFTISFDVDDENDLEIQINVYIGKTNTPSNFSISINYESPSNPVAEGITWEGANNATSFRIHNKTPENDTYTAIGTLESQSDFENLNFNNLFGSNDTRIYIAMTGCKKPIDSTLYQIPMDTDFLESDLSDYLILDPPGEDNPAPYTPTGISVRISGPEQAVVTFEGNEKMLDLEKHVIKYWLDDGNETEDDAITVTVPGQTYSTTVSNLIGYTHYIFKVIAYDYYDNQTESEEHPFLMEQSYSSLEDPLLFEGGCFISKLHYRTSTLYKGITAIITVLFFLIVMRKKKGFSKILLPTLLGLLIFHNTAFSGEKNTIGIKGGAVVSSDETMETGYEQNGRSVILFYDRDLFYNFSFEFEAGYIARTGYEFTTSGQVTEIETTLSLAPVTSSLKYNYEISPFISTYIGGGLDFWYYKEENEYKEFDAADDEKYGVGGYHGKIGLYLRTMDEDIKKNVGVIVEAVYSRIDRLGENEIDLGGIHYNFGLFYMF